MHVWTEEQRSGTPRCDTTQVTPRALLGDASVNSVIQLHLCAEQASNTSSHKEEEERHTDASNIENLLGRITLKQEPIMDPTRSFPSNTFSK